VAIAERILKCAAEYGIDKRDIVFDTLAMTISADTRAASATLGALSTIKHTLGCHTSLGVSNISFGLPCRDAVNSTFFATALTSGLSAAIMNPYSAEMMRTYYAYRALAGLDENCGAYIENVPQLVVAQAAAAPVAGAVNV
jgi:5-methyltetrahydrofolate--homocysteine methyltransferase